MEKLLQYLRVHKRIIDIGLIVGLALLLSIPGLSSKANIYFDDGSQHLMRAYGAYQTLVRGENTNIITQYANGFGYSWDLFYGPLSEYGLIILGVIFHSFNLGLKVLLCIILALAGIFLYQFVYEMTCQRHTSLLAAIIYITSPYFFTDMYTRHSLGECMAFVFIPLVFLGLYRLFNTEKSHVFLIFGAVGLLLSHNISTVFTAIFAGIYCIINLKNMSRTRVQKGLLVDIIWIILLTAFFWEPFLETRFFTDYRVFEKGAMATKESVVENALELKELLITANDGSYVFEIGVPVILMFVFSIMTVGRLKENRKEYIFFLVSGMMSVWMSTKYFPWKILPSCCYIIQFPWRMLLFSSFFLAVVCSINMATLIKNFQAKDVVIISIICVIYLFSRYSYMPYAEGVANVKDYKIPSISGQNGEWLPGMGRLEYLPSKAYKKSFYIAVRDNGIVKLEGDCEIQEVTKMGQHLSAKILTTKQEARVELPYMAYPGYEVKLDGMPLEVFETENGFLGVVIDESDSGFLEVQYTGTKMMNLAKMISLISGIVFLRYVYKRR